MNVKKMDGTMQPYDERKLRASLLRAAADERIAALIVEKVRGILYDGIRTKQIYDAAFKELKRLKPLASSKYGIKSAILSLGGNEGFAFEKFAARILEKQGYNIETNVIAQGKFITHEIDVVAKNKGETVMAECKHHHTPWMGCSIQTALYVYARFLDVKESFSVPMLITNTKFSDQVLVYSNGVGLRLMGWNYPEENSLRHNIETLKVYPITMLTSLAERDARILLDRNILLVSDIALMDKKDLGSILQLPETKLTEVLSESRLLMEGNGR